MRAAGEFLHVSPFFLPSCRPHLLNRNFGRHIPPSDVCPRVAAMACLVRHQRLSTEPLPKPPSDIAPRAYPEKLHSLVDDISRLTLTEVAQLNELLKAREAGRSSVHSLA